MDSHNRGLPLNWTYFYQEKSMDELRQSLLLTMELEDTRLKAQEEIKLRDEQISQLKLLLTTAIKERDLAQENCQKLYLEKMLLQQQQDSGISSIDNDHNPIIGIDSNNGGFSSSDTDESIVSSQQHLIQPPPAPPHPAEFPIIIDRPLPEKGKFLQAVMKAGPLLQTLLLAGPLPQWRHPPPPLDTCQIPPPPPPLSLLHDDDNLCGMKRKRGVSECSDHPMSC